MGRQDIGNNLELEERANLKDHIYVRLKRLAVQAREIASELDKCAPTKTIGSYARSHSNTRLRAVLDSVEELASLSDAIRDESRKLGG